MSEARRTSTGGRRSKQDGCAMFKQQKLKAWQPVLTPKWAIVTFLVCGLSFLGVGILLLITNSKVSECMKEYFEPECANGNVCAGVSTLTIERGDCVALKNEDTMIAPVFVQYRLINFHQNHRRYVKSRNDKQLRGVVMTSDELASCDPVITLGDDGPVLSPCGLVARSVFNDTFILTYQNNTPIVMDESAETIAWATDVEKKFKNPPADAPVFQWLDENIFPSKVENGHFIVWMRNAALPDFRKLYGKIDSDVTLPLTVTIQNRFPVKRYNGRKLFVLTTTSWSGGRNPFLGAAYTTVAIICIAFGLFFCINNARHPRTLGDVGFLDPIRQRK